MEIFILRNSTVSIPSLSTLSKKLLHQEHNTVACLYESVILPCSWGRWKEVSNAEHQAELLLLEIRNSKLYVKD